MTDNEKLEKSRELERKWDMYLAEHGVDQNSRKLQKDLFEFNKANFSVLVSRIEYKDFLSQKTVVYGCVDFHRVSRWADSDLFFDVVHGRYTPTEFTKSVEMVITSASATFDFKYSEENAIKIGEVLKAGGYNVEYKF